MASYNWPPMGSETMGTVTTVSVVSANGFAGSVANPTTTPAITLSTTINAPVLAGNGTAISAATLGNLTEATSSVLTITGGTGSVIGSGTSIQVKLAGTSQSGYLSSTDWNTFNGKGTGTVTAISIASANGFAGSSSGGATPALTLSTSINSPVLAGDGTSILAATTTGTGSTVVLSASPTISNLSAGSTPISNVVDPTTAQQAATKAYVDAAVSALQPLASVYAASAGSNIAGTYLNGVSGVGATFTTTATTAFVLDGTSPAVLARVLIKDQTSGFQNGVYQLTTQAVGGVSGAVLTRTLDYDTAADMNSAGLIPVLNGTVNALSSWQQTAVITTVGMDSLVFAEFTANPSLYLLKANNLSDVSNANTSLNNLLPSQTSNSGKVLTTNGTSASWLTPTGTVTSVALSVPATSIFGVSGSPVTTSGTLGLTTTGNSGGIPYFSSTSALSSSALLTQYGVIYGGGAGASPVATAAGTTGQALVATTSAAPSWGALGSAGVATATFTAPTVSKATASGTGTGGFGSSQTGWLFTVTGWTGTIAIGDTYTNNGHTYTAIAAQTNGASGQTLWMSGTGATSGSTLTKGTSASGPATITFSATTAYYTYTTPTSPRTPLALKIRLMGAGGGGGGGNNSTPGNSGTLTAFGALVLIANGGGGGIATNSTDGSTGGTASIATSGTVLQMIALQGGPGGGSQYSSNTGGQYVPGGNGAYSPFGGAGVGICPTQAAIDAIPNTGSGGGGGGCNPSNGYTAFGGAAGGYLEAIITSPAASYPYIIGTGGSGASAGTGGYQGSNGASGQALIEEQYQ